MEDNLFHESIISIRKKIEDLFAQVFIDGGDFKNELEIETKSDKTLVTFIDKRISDIVKESSLMVEGMTFFSEEDHNELNFPAIILDPIDGTRELCLGRAEVAVSLSVIGENYRHAWIYNPFTGFEINSTQIDGIKNLNHYIEPGKLSGLISRSEWGKLESKIGNMDVHWTPRGSIAYKLGLLAAGACDFVVSYRGKAIWDISAGSELCSLRNIQCFDKSGNIVELDKVNYDGPFLWCHKDYLSKLKEIVFHGF